jgi:hypothetical protein
VWFTGEVTIRNRKISIETSVPEIMASRFIGIFSLKVSEQIKKLKQANKCLLQF